MTNPYLLHGEELARAEAQRVDLPASMQALREAVDTACGTMDRLRAEKAELVQVLNRATNMRPALLMTLGYVPEPVLEYCNDVRAVLGELKEPK